MIEIIPEAYLESFEKNGEISIHYKSFLLDDLLPIYEVLENLLKFKKLDKFVAYAKTASRELIQNAIKATQKRYYFHVRGLDIQKDYLKGIENFSEFLQESKYNPLPEIFEFATKIRISFNEEVFQIFVINHGELVEQEQQAIIQMLERGKRIQTVAELLEDEVKHKEGGGIGLSMIMVLGKSLNISSPLSYRSENGFTEFCLKLPLK